MSVKLLVEGGLTAMTRGKNIIEVDGRTVGECLNHLVTLIPKLKEALFFEKEGGVALRSNIEVLVNGSRTEALSTAVKDGDQLHIKQGIR